MTSHQEQHADDARTSREERDRKRLEVLAEAKHEASSFLVLLRQYSIINESSDTVRLDGKQESNGVDMLVQRRQLKIDRLHQICELTSSYADNHLLKMELLHKRQQHMEEEGKRSWWTGWLKLKSLKALDLLTNISSEIDILSAHRLSSALIPSSTAIRNETKAKVTQPFVLTSGIADRKALASQVFRPGHRLPTMSIDEYLALEMRRGNIKSHAASTTPIRGIDESDEMEDEKRLLQLRKQDEFRDEHRRGSGNTFNRG